jgi:cytochrome b561/polyisoprenoid-binding protein YceI
MSHTEPLSPPYSPPPSSSDLSNTPSRYGTVTKGFHWAIALGIFVMVPLGLIAADAPYDTAEALARKATLFSLHKTLGIAVFLIALARILWALTQTKPVALHPERKAEVFAAETVHWVLYGSLVLVPLTGWIDHAATDGFAPIWWPFGQGLPLVPKSPELAHSFGVAHEILQWVMVGSVVLHVAGALKHHVIDKDATLKRMWFGRTEAGHGTHRSILAAPVAAVAIWGAALGFGVLTGMFGGHGGSSAAPAAALAEVESDWRVQEGTLGLSVQQFGQTVSGSFADWTADITFDESDGTGEKGDVAVTVSIPSLTLGSVTNQALGADFLAAESNPTATFTAPILRTDDGYLAEGVLTIKGAEASVPLPFTLSIDGDTATMSGQATVDRRAFGIGENMSDPKQLGFDVVVDVQLVATRAAE